MCLVVIGAEIFSKKEMAFLFRSRDSSFSPNNVIVSFWSLKEYSVGDSSSSTFHSSRDWKLCLYKEGTLFVGACWTTHTTINILKWFFRLLKNFYPLSELRKNQFVCSSKGIMRTWHVDEHWTDWWSLLTRDWRVFCALKVYPNTL